ncbi:hypothetical protein XENOCAPTIV_011120, partial [Xenoophorus captivus]
LQNHRVNVIMLDDLKGEGKSKCQQGISHIAQHLHPPVFIGADLLVRLGAQLVTFNQVVWARANAPSSPFLGTPEVMLSGQIIPHACQAISEIDSLVPQRTAGLPIRLTVKTGQKVQNTRIFFQPLPYFWELNLVVCGTPMLELNNRSTYLLVENPTQVPIQVTTRKPLGMLIDTSFHDFGLTIPLIGDMPLFVSGGQDSPDVVFMFPSDMITVERHEVLTTKSTCGATLGAEGNLVVYALVTHPGQLAQEELGTQDSSSGPYPGFETEVSEQLEKADVLSTEEERTALKNLFYEYQSVLSKDSHDCGVTDLHTVRIPTNPNAPPTFVRQYKISLAAFELIQEILDKLLEKHIIRECNSTACVKTDREMAPDNRLPFTEQAGTPLMLAHDSPGPGAC